MLFYPYGEPIDTLPVSKFYCYKTLTLKEVGEKEIAWIDKKFEGLKYKPYSGGSKNNIFHTYLLEKISKEKFVIYPVIWRNEGVIDKGKNTFTQKPYKV